MKQQNSFEQFLSYDDDGNPVMALPDHEACQRLEFEDTKANAIMAMDHAINLPYLDLFSEVMDQYSTNHIKDTEEYEPPEPALVKELFAIVKKQLNLTDRELAEKLDLLNDRSIRSYRSGERRLPMKTWHRFLIITGWKKQEILPVIGLF